MPSFFRYVLASLGMARLGNSYAIAENKIQKNVVVWRSFGMWGVILIDLGSHVGRGESRVPDVDTMPITITDGSSPRSHYELRSMKHCPFVADSTKLSIVGAEPVQKL
ncbi:MAG: hypothetical protein FE78DRAFT_269026 [Acidomyces sp. 'richmondensis']|nr:MAG: hypothetical protein FE78DRAFT_269026 [Acidomyces sp. 'richmondensis']